MKYETEEIVQIIHETVLRIGKRYIDVKMDEEYTLQCLDHFKILADSIVSELYNIEINKNITRSK